MKEKTINFISTVEGLESIEECRPRPAKSFLPEWWKDVPSGKTVKNCPSFPDFFSQGYIIPMWADTILIFDKEKDVNMSIPASSMFQWEYHNNSQFLDYADANFIGSKGSYVFKTTCPWRIITPKGWSVLQLPLFYHFNNDFSILPGIIDTDTHHQINQQVLYHGNGNKVEIFRGQPFVLYIPFERKKNQYEVRSMNKKDRKKFSIDDLKIATKFNGAYRAMQRNRDQNVR